MTYAIFPVHRRVQHFTYTIEWICDNIDNIDTIVIVIDPNIDLRIQDTHFYYDLYNLCNVKTYIQYSVENWPSLLYKQIMQTEYPQNTNTNIFCNVISNSMNNLLFECFGGRRFNKGIHKNQEIQWTRNYTKQEILSILNSKQFDVLNLSKQMNSIINRFSNCHAVIHQFVCHENNILLGFYIYSANNDTLDFQQIENDYTYWLPNSQYDVYDQSYWTNNNIQQSLFGHIYYKTLNRICDEEDIMIVFAIPQILSNVENFEDIQNEDSPFYTFYSKYKKYCDVLFEKKHEMETTFVQNVPLIYNYIPIMQLC